MSANNISKNNLIYAIMFLILVNVTRIQELFTFLIPLRVGLIANLLAIIFLIQCNRISPNIPLLRIPQVKLLIALYVLCLFSIPFSIWKGQSFNFVIKALPISLSFIFLILYAGNSYVDLRKVVWAYWVGVFLMALFTILSKGAGRVSSTSTYDPNDIAAICVLTLPLLYFYLKVAKGKIKIFILGSLITLLFALVLTVSRGGFVGLLITTVLILIKDTYQRWITKLFVVGILALAFILYAPESYWQRINTITSEQDYNRTSKYGRESAWRQSVKIILSHPFTGTGAGTIVKAIGESWGPEGGHWMTSHNSFLQIGAELGIGGLFLFVALLSYSILDMHRLNSLYRREGSPPEYAWLVTSLEISLITFGVVGFFLSWAYQPILFFLIALSGVVKKLELLKNVQGTF